MRLLSPLIAVLPLLGCSSGLSNPWKLEGREVGGAFRIEVPRGLETGSRVDDSEWVSVHFDRIHSWAVGSSTPYQTRLHLLVFAPGVDAARQKLLFTQAPAGLDQCTNIRWQVEESRGAVRLRTGECRHSVNTLENLSWIAEAYHPVQGIRLTLLVWKKDLDLASARDVVLRGMASFQALPGLAAAFDRARAAPRLAEEAFAARRAALKQTLASLGFPSAAPGQVREHDGFFYLMSEGEECDFVIGRLLGSVVPQSPPVGENIPGQLAEAGRQLRNDVDLFWFVQQNGEWTPHSSHANYYIPAPIAGRLSPQHNDPRRAYFYAFSSVRLRDAESWRAETLRSFVETARLGAVKFARGEVVKPGS